MELGLSLGDASRPFGALLGKDRAIRSSTGSKGVGRRLGFCMALGMTSNGREEEEEEEEEEERGSDENLDGDDADDESDEALKRKRDDFDKTTPVQLDLLPLAPVPRGTSSSRLQVFPWPPDNGNSEVGSPGNMGISTAAAAAARGLEAEERAGMSSSPNSTGGASSFQMDFGFVYRRGGNDVVEGGERASSRASDEDENGLARKKLRLSKEQSAYLEESFKEHNTLNPKQKVALARQLNLRPRQVEVWFQNRRARTKLKQTEVDCEYLKRCCETLTEENRRLNKELQELRALKSSSSTSNPFCMQFPATTLTMCPSCERVATTTTTTATKTTTTTTHDPAATSKAAPFALSRPRFYPFPHTQPHQSSSSAS